MKRKIIEPINIFDYSVNLETYGHYDKFNNFIIDKLPVEQILIKKVNELILEVNHLSSLARSNPSKGGEDEEESRLYKSNK